MKGRDDENIPCRTRRRPADLREACLVLSVSRSKMEALVRSGQLYTLRLGYRTVRLSHAEVEAFIAHRRSKR
jgi:excisionase family DNA binding protein